jgi:uncharacterized damage-inducible protein DinB
MMQKTVRTAGYALACCLFAAAFGHSQANPAKPAIGSPQTPAQVYGKLLDGIEKQFIELADAMPEDKYNFVPTQGDFKTVRTFGEQVKHVALANYYIYAGLSDSEFKGKSDAIEKLTTKAEIMQALRDSYKPAHEVVDGMTPENAFVTTAHGTRAGIMSMGLAHNMDHYGQLVVYLRMNGIIPPASRPKK